MPNPEQGENKSVSERTPLAPQSSDAEGHLNNERHPRPFRYCSLGCGAGLGGLATYLALANVWIGAGIIGTASLSFFGLFAHDELKNAAEDKKSQEQPPIQPNFRS